jgi:multidrug efflux pump subunit AcrB
MAGRVVYYYERQLSTTVNDIDHVESQSYAGMGVVKIFFHPGVDIRTATAQVTAISQTVLKQMPPGMTPPLVMNYNASTVPILQLALSSPTLGEQKTFDFGINAIRPGLAQVEGAAVPTPMAGANVRSRSTSIPPRFRRTTCRPPMSAPPLPRKTRSCPRAPRASARLNIPSI